MLAPNQLNCPFTVPRYASSQLTLVQEYSPYTPPLPRTTSLIFCITAVLPAQSLFAAAAQAHRAGSAGGDSVGPTFKNRRFKDPLSKTAASYCSADMAERAKESSSLGICL